MRQITPELMKILNTGWSATFNKGFEGAETHFREIAMVVASTTAETVYPFLGQLPRLREWVGERILRGLSVHSFAIKNRKFEDSVHVLRTDIEDDVAGVYTPLFEELGAEAARHPDRLVFELLASGFTSPCYDNQNFFDESHPGKNPAGEEVLISNVQDGAGAPWFLLDTSRVIRPIIYQERSPYNKLVRVDDDANPHVFMKDQYVYGIRGRSNAGFGLWQLAFASKAALTVENYELARTAMTTLRGDEGSLLGVKPTTLLVPMTLEGDGRRVLKAQNLEGGQSNVWFDSAQLIATHWLG